MAFTARGSLLATVLVAWASIAAAAELPPLTSGLTEIEPLPAPPLALYDLDDEQVDIGDFAGKVVVVNFWATWCPPCRREMPSLARMHNALAGHGVEVIAVDVGESFETVFAFLGSIDPLPEFPIVFDRDGNMLEAWGVRGLPTTVIVAPDGRLKWRAVGGREFDHPDLIEKLTGLAGGG